MNKNVINLFFLLIIFLVTNCSFDNKTGIWSEGVKEKKRVLGLEQQQKNTIDVVKVYSSEEVYLKEVKSNKNTNLTTAKNKLSWEMSGSNLQNFLGNIYLSKINNNFLKKKIGKDKFAIYKVISSPIVSDNIIFFADDAGTIFSINQKGKIIWKNNIYKKLYKKIYKNLTLSIYKNKIFVADNIGFVYVLNAKNGKIIWLKNHGIPLKSNIKIFNESIFLINQDNRIISLDVKDGSLIWDIRSVASFIKSQHFLSLAISENGDLVALNSSGDLIKIKTENGRIYWSLNTMGTLYAHDTDFFESSDVVIADNEIIFSTRSSIFSFDLNNGYLNWRENIVTKNTPIIDGNSIFLVTDNGFFVNLDRKTGKTVWSTNILKILKKKKRITEITGFVMGSGKIYATTQNGYLIICSAFSGKVESFKNIGDEIATTPIISNNSLYILTDKPRIFGFN